MAWRIRTYQATPNQGPDPIPEDEAFVAIIRRERHLASFTFAATEEEAETKAETFIAAEEAKAAKYRKPKAAQADVEEAV